MFFIAVGVGVSVCLAGLVAMSEVGRLRARDWIAINGLPATATIVRIEELGVRRASHPEYRIELDFQAPSTELGPYRQSSVEVLPERIIVHTNLPAHIGAKLVPTTVIPVRVHPKDKGRVVVDERALTLTIAVATQKGR